MYKLKDEVIQSSVLKKKLLMMVYGTEYLHKLIHLTKFVSLTYFQNPYSDFPYLERTVVTQ